MTTPDPPADALRREVGLLRAEHTRRVFAARVGLGTPGRRGPGTVLSGPVDGWRGAPWPPPPWVDAGLRFDVADRLLAHRDLEHAGLHAWLLRPGVVSLHDEDQAWLAAVRHACAAHSVELVGFWVVTRYGWLDPVGGESRAWKRLRVRP